MLICISCFTLHPHSLEWYYRPHVTNGELNPDDEQFVQGQDIRFKSMCSGTKALCPVLSRVTAKETMEPYSAVRKDKILPFATTCVDLENIMLSKISQKK